MKIVSFSEIKDELISNMRRKMLIPVIGSGFTKGCEAFKGKVPSGQDYKEYMISRISSHPSITDIEVQSLKEESFSSVSSIYNKLIDLTTRKEYLKYCFTKVELQGYKQKILQLPWPYIYTLNIDDGIENNSSYNHIVYANRPVEKGIFNDFSCVIKLHGDVLEMLTYSDAQSEIFTQKQYVDSLKKNVSLLSKLHHDSIYQNLIFIGCSLDDEIDLLAYSSESVVDTAKYFCTTKKPSLIQELKYESYGITHCIVFDSYDDIYKGIYESGIEAEKISLDDLEKYKKFSFEKLPAKYEDNKPYFFFGKSLIDKDHRISIPSFFISRTITNLIFENLFKYNLQFIVGSGCSGKSYILVDIASRLKRQDVFLFETKDSLSNIAFENLLNKKNIVILADETSFSDNQIEYLISNLSILIKNNINLIVAVNKHNKAVNGILQFYELQNAIKHNEIPQIHVKNKFDDNESNQISPLLATTTIGIFQKNDTIVDNIIGLSKELSEKNKYHSIEPKLGSVQEIAALIALAIERKIYSTRAVKLDIYDELALQCQHCMPLIDQESTWSFESSNDENSSVKYVINAEFWLCYQLSEFASKKENYKLIVEAFKYIISKIIFQEGTPNLKYKNQNNSYGEYILFDNINKIFYSNKFSRVQSFTLIRDIYEGLNDLLSTDPSYMHQRAKCYIKSAYYEDDKDKKLEYLSKAFRDANVSFQVFDTRYQDSKNEKVLISADHVLYTKALIVCHMCHINDYKSISENTEAIRLLYSALKSPYNTYDFAKKDSFNYQNVIDKIIRNAVIDRDIVDGEINTLLSYLFNIISQC